MEFSLVEPNTYVIVRCTYVTEKAVFSICF